VGKATAYNLADFSISSFFIQAADTKDTCQCCELVGEMKGKYVTPSGPGNKFLFMICIGMNVIPHGKESESQ